jgi:hypothetical protein
MSNQNPLIEEGQTAQWPNEKREKTCPRNITQK